MSGCGSPRAALQRFSSGPPSPGTRDTCPTQECTTNIKQALTVLKRIRIGSGHCLAQHSVPAAEQQHRIHMHLDVKSRRRVRHGGLTFFPTMVQPRMHWSWKQCLHCSCTVDSAPQGFASPAAAQPGSGCPAWASSLALAIAPKSRSSPLQMPHALVDTAMRLRIPRVAACR